MSMIELPLNDIIKVYKLATLGKVIGGLIHNINGPLQNLCLNIEMTAYSLKNDSNLDEDSVKDILNRLKKMETEFDRIDQLIRVSSSKTNPDNDLNALRQLDDLLNEEMYFLRTNLYFKHKVQADLNIHDNLPLIKNLPQDSLLALCWFLQALVEDLEIREIETISLSASSDNHSVVITFNTYDKPLSDSIMKCLNDDIRPVKDKQQEDIDVGLWLSLIILGNCNSTVNGLTESESSKITITIPVQNGND